MLLPATSVSIKYSLTIIAILLIVVAYIRAREYADSKPIAFYISIGVLFLGIVFHRHNILIPHFIITLYVIYFVILVIGVAGIYFIESLG